jgi:hypothetical protein
MVWNKRNPKWGYNRFFDYLVRHNRWRTVSTGDCESSSRNHRDNRHQSNHQHYLYYYLAFCLFSVGPAFAESPTVSNNANPIAAATGNVTNQAVQFQNNGAPSRQQFTGGNSCNGTTMTVSPFYMGNDTLPTGYTRNNNYGMQLNFSVPLDGGMIEQCKQIAKRHEEKLRLDYELVRALKCTEIMKAGFTFRPGSRVEVLCHDIVPIVSLTNEEKSN